PDQPAPQQGNPNTAASQGTAQSQPITAADFVTQATSSNLFEVQSSQLALERSKNEQIRQFAQRMVKDHTDAMNRMKSTAQGQQIPGEPAQQHSQMLEQLRNAEDGQFDARYLQMQQQAHQQAVALHERFAQNGDQQQLKQLAQQMLPIL